MSNKLHNLYAETVIREVLRDVGVEPLNEMAPTYGKRIEKPSISVHYIGRNHLCTDYFKLVRGTSYESSPVVCRISLREAKYIIHDKSGKKSSRKGTKGKGGKKTQFFPTPEEIDALVELLAKDSDRYDGMNTLQAMMVDANEHLKNNGFKPINPDAVTPKTYSNLPVYV